MPELLRMIEHRRVVAAAFDASIDVLGGAQPELEHLLPASEQRGERFLFADANAYAYWSIDRHLTLVDRRARRGLVWYVAADEIPSWEIGRPFLLAIKGLSLATAWTPVHAAAVARGDKGVLMAGLGGAGKTSAALACVDAGWRYVGDDFVMLTGRPLRASSLYSSARIRSDMFVRLPNAMAALREYSVDTGELKAEVDVGRLKGVRIGDAEIAAIVLPQRAGSARPIVKPVGLGSALRALAATTFAILPGDEVALYHRVADMLEGTPCFLFDPGADLAAVPEALERLI